MFGHGMGEGKQILSTLVSKTYDGKDLANFPSRKPLLRYELLWEVSFTVKLQFKI